MRQTSLLAYWSLGPVKGERQKQVLDALMEVGAACNRELSELSHLPINVVTPRVNELVSLGRVKEAYRDRDSKTGRRVIFWRPVSQVEREFGDEG